ncbi:NADP-dependent oxidoreductase [Companilactobacillus keshanensis]|uniref:NADP-dependent oxidoreductase n=1 Tax=Companilactobacillus keshanensis TaxID=2486003 RepID=A0ABW4BU81_9LACO|nr:NADP-dependent oxidoreductase [Companilactobacillus keshanensis]
MQAIIQDSYNGIDDLKIREVTDPKLSPLSVLIETKFTPVLPYDWRTETGELQNIRPVKLPMVIGYGFSGVVKNVGSLRNNNLIGQKVIGASISGSNSTLVDSRIPPLLFKVPENVDLDVAVTIIGGADTALGTMNKLHLNENDTVLIIGASGGIGTYMIQLLKLQNATVVAIGHKSNVEFLKSVGADEVIDYTTEIEKQLSICSNITKVIDTAGNIDLLKMISKLFPTIKIVSIATDRFGQFIQPNILPNDYVQLLSMLSDKSLRAYIQEKFYYQDVKEAQYKSKNSHSQGRILLSY